MTLLGLCAAAPALAQDPPRNFNECLLRYLPGTTSDRAAASIERACAEEFPAASPGLPNRGGIVRTDPPRSVPSTSAPPVIPIHGRNLRQIEIDPRNYRVYPEGVQQIVELLIHNRGRIYTVRELTVKVDGVRLGQDEFGVIVDIPPESSSVVRIRMPRADLDRARFEVEEARGVQYAG